MKYGDLIYVKSDVITTATPLGKGWQPKPPLLLPHESIKLFI